MFSPTTSTSSSSSGRGGISRNTKRRRRAISSPAQRAIGGVHGADQVHIFGTLNGFFE